MKSNDEISENPIKDSSFQIPWEDKINRKKKSHNQKLLEILWVRGIGRDLHCQFSSSKKEQGGAEEGYIIF